MMNEIRQKNKKCAYIKRLSIDRIIEEDGVGKYVVEISLTEVPVHYKAEVLCLRFVDVTDIKIGNLNGLYQCIFNIEDIEAHQLEGLKYRVIDLSGDNISFYCARYEIVEE